jgi:chemotaxis protein CheD
MPEPTAVMLNVFLQPAELYLGQTPARVRTILGSCVAVVFRVPRLGLAAMSHCLLPAAGSPAFTLPRPEAQRYVDSTIEIVLADFLRRGARLEEVEVKLFGGADQFENKSATRGYHVGQRNIEAARTLLAANGLYALAHCVGGHRGRLIEFHSTTGDVFVKHLDSHAGTFARQEAP